MVQGRDLTGYDGLVLDEETGEIVEWPADFGPSRIDFLQGAYREAADEEKAWEARKLGFGRALKRFLEMDGVTAYNGSGWRSTIVAPKDAEVVYRATVDLLLAAKVINAEQVDELKERTAEALTKLDRDALDAMVAEGTLTAEQRDLLIVREPRAGYVRTGKLPKVEPKRAKALRSEYDAEAVQ